MYSAELAGRAVTFVRNLTHSKGDFAGQPFRLRAWQEDIVRRLFGTVREDGLRQYRTCYIELARKNGKSELAAAIALYMLLADRENGAEVYSAAADREQAGLVFAVAARMVRNDPQLSTMCKIVDSRKTISVPSLGRFYRAISAEAFTKHGVNASAVIYDEVHAAPNRELWDVLKTSMGARSQPLMLAITTAGWDRTSICWELHELATMVRDGLVDDPTFLPVLYGAPDDADWTDEAVWHAANPALGDFRSLDEMREACERAKLIPAQENVFRRLYLSQWTSQSDRWLSMDAWRACAEPLRDLRGRECFVGMDLSRTTDLSAVAYLFPDDDGSFDLLVDHFMLDRDLELREQRDRAPYLEWIKAGHIKATSGPAIDLDVVRDTIHERADQFVTREINFDPYSAAPLVRDLADDGFTCLRVPQSGERISPAMNELERMVLDGRLRHGGNPVLDWSADNVVVKSDAGGNVKPDKSKNRARIDGVMATLIALAGYLKAEPPAPQAYQDRGLVFLG